MKINYDKDMQFSVTFDSGAKSDLYDIPSDGTALVSTPDGKKLAVVALGNHDGPLTPDTAYVLSASSTQVTGEVPTEEDYAMIEDDDDEEEGEDGVSTDDEDDDEVEVIEGDELEDGDDDDDFGDN